mmetsp:Transcript_3790/g.8089  ORF Transcript_3790/g.8089 Transcript_3790/m.8089 type:complete len:555 (-) Transcript_3790:561-2225(-)
MEKSPTLKSFFQTSFIVQETSHLVNLLHGTLLIVIIIEGREVIHIIIVLISIVVINGQTKLHQTVDTRSEGGRFIKAESRGEETGIVKKPDEVLHGLVRLISIGLLAKSSDDGVGGIDLHGLLRAHVGTLAGVTKSLRLHDTLHVGRPAVLAGHETARTVSKTVGYNHLLDLVIKNLLHELAQSFGLSLGFLEGGLLILIFFHLKSLLGGAEELLALKFLELLDAILINGVNHVENLVSLLLELLKEGRGLNTALRLSSDVIDTGLLVIHTADVVIKAGHGVTRLGGVVTKELGKLGAVGGVLVDTKLEILGEGLVELVVGILILSQIVEHLNALLDQVLLDDSKDLVLLKSLTRNVEGKILGINNSLDETEPLGHEIFTVVHDEDTTDIQLDVIVLLLGSSLELVEGSTLRAEQNGTELKLSLHREVLYSSMLLPVVGDGLVKGSVFVLRDIIGLAHPEWLHVVEVLPLVANFLDLLGFLLLLGVFFIDLLNLWLVVVLIFILIIIVVVISDLLLSGLFGVELDREANELTVLLDQVLDPLFFEVLAHVLLQV